MQPATKAGALDCQAFREPAKTTAVGCVYNSHHFPLIYKGFFRALSDTSHHFLTLYLALPYIT
jgi:hypothetical protein